MLLDDKNVAQIASWGVVTRTHPFKLQPPIAELSLERYQKYQALLSNAGAIGMTRSEGPDPDICILVWSSGWAGGAIHVAVCRFGRDALPLTSDTRAMYSYFRVGDHWYGMRDDT